MLDVEAGPVPRALQVSRYCRPRALLFAKSKGGRSCYRRGEVTDVA